MTQANKPWLSVVGIGEDGVSGLSEAARNAISQAVLVAGGARHLALAKVLITGETIDWPSPPHKAIPLIAARKPEHVCVLTSGDPFYYGMGAVLAKTIPPDEMQVFPAPSTFSIVAARMGWALQDVVKIGLNGRPLALIIPHLQPSARIIALSADETTPELLAALLNRRGFGHTKMTVFEHLKGAKERVRASTAAAFAYDDVARLNCMALEVPGGAPSLPLVSGLADDYFEHDGQLTKAEIRAITLANLAPRRGELLWDIGLGAGSVAIEWLRADAQNRAIGIEKNPARAARALANAEKLGAPQLSVITGEAPLVLKNLEAPDAIFIGGGATHDGMLEAAWNALKPGGRLVVNAIALETQTLLGQAYQCYGGRLIRIGIERMEKLGTMQGFRPAMPVVQWSVTKGSLT